jgi:hypothetical protein
MGKAIAFNLWAAGFAWTCGSDRALEYQRSRACSAQAS